MTVGHDCRYGDGAARRGGDPRGVDRLQRGLVDNELYGVVLVMALVTTILVPPVLKKLFDREVRPRSKGSAASSRRAPLVLRANERV